MKHYYRSIYSGEYVANLEDLDKTKFPPWLKGKWHQISMTETKTRTYHNMAKYKEEQDGN